MKKNSFKRKIAIAITGVMLALSLVGCKGSSSVNESGKKEVIDFWYHGADENSSKMFEEIFAKLNESQDQYEFVFTGISNKDFPTSFANAIATNTKPDVITTEFYSIMSYVATDSLLPLQDEFETWDVADDFLPSAIQSVKDLAGGEDLYGIPYGYNQDLSWYNTAQFTEKGITVPETQADFLALCEQYADPQSGSYFFSLRGGKPHDNLISWLFTYTDGLGNNGEFFDENGKCIIDAPEFAEAMDAYADIYKNKWVSGDSVNNGFAEMVAEFGAGTSSYIMHNSSSAKTHETNLGADNYYMSHSLANEEGRYFNSAIQPQVFAMCNNGEDTQTEGALYLIEYLSSAENISTFNQTITKIPTNTACYEEDWFKNSDLMQLCMEIAQDENNNQVNVPYWLPNYSSFINGDMTTDFQAVLLGDMTSQECLTKWAEFLTAEQQEYLASK